MKICLWGNIGKALIGQTSGGGELQIALLAKGLARGGNEVVIIDYKINEEFVTEDGIKILPIRGYNNGIKMIRTFTHRIPKLYASLRDQKADVYYCRIRDFRHIIAWFASRRVKGRFVLGLAADLEIMSIGMRWNNYYKTHIHKPWVIFDGVLSEIVYPFLLRKSDAVFVQHEGQQKMLLKKHIPSIIFLNLIDIASIPEVSDSKHDYFIYVGWLDNRKGFTEFVEVIRRSPQHYFKIVGPPRDKSASKYYEELKSFPNVILMGKLDHSDALKEIASSKALISTSPLEGFPNIFIEAWASGVPVISLNVDPGCVIRINHLGEVSNGNIDKLLEAMDNIRFTPEFAARAKEYVEHHYVLNSGRIEEINKIFMDLITREAKTGINEKRVVSKKNEFLSY